MSELLEYRCVNLPDFSYRLFEISPKLKVLFPFDPVPDNDGLRAHALNVVETVGAAVDNLDDLRVLKPELENLGKVHAAFELSAKDYEASRHFRPKVTMFW